MSRGETEITDVPLQGQERDAGHGDPRNRDGTENSRAEPEQSRTAAERAESATEQPPDSDRASLGKSDHSLTGDVSTNENCRLIPQHTSTPNHTLRAEAGGRENPAADLRRDHAPPAGLANGAPPICTPPTAAAAGHPGWRPPQPPQCNGKVCRDKKRLPSTASSGQKSLKTTASQIQQVAGDDLCASLVLACLFCRLWECLAAAGEGCWACGACVCASARGALPCCCCCCCEPAVLEPLPADSPLCCCCGGCTGLTPDCSVCDLCLQATECLELAMEISQLLFH